MEEKMSDFIKETLREIVRSSIAHQKLFELVFSEEGRRLWAGIPEDQLKQIIKEELRRI